MRRVRAVVISSSSTSPELFLLGGRLDLKKKQLRRSGRRRDVHLVFVASLPTALNLFSTIDFLHLMQAARRASRPRRLRTSSLIAFDQRLSAKICGDTIFRSG